jgi:predicted nucleotidyltransferase
MDETTKTASEVIRRDDILSVLSAHSSELAEFGVRSLALFGSAARGEAVEASDVDLLVEFARPVDLFEFIDLKTFLESVLGCPVDLVTPGALKPRMREQVAKELVYVIQGLETIR